MEAHPVPQNITNFEFHLVGDMTLKQFGYLAGGLGFAYMIFFLFATSFPFVAWPIVIISVIIGISFAFLPIQERPLDHWVSAFFKAIFRPTKFNYKSDIVIKEDPFFKKRLEFFLSQLSATPVIGLSWGDTPTITPPPQPKPVIKPAVQEVKKEAVSPAEPVKLPAPADSKLPTQEDLKATVELADKAQIIRKKITETEEQLSRVKARAIAPGEDKELFAKDFQVILNNLQKLNSEAGEISKKLAVLSKTPIKTPAIATPAKSMPTISLTAVPNILNGIVTDLQGNYIEGAILVAHDKQNLPVRALKTNKLGQFIAATPLPNGDYVVTCEKDNLIFDVIKIEFSGQVLQPVIISAKKGAL
ncbi:PrgI family protein [Candidatus Daviesbacteria bacterium]|nr:PrgI family protein [Candidatus Daviesbacteria bacterium]